MLNYFLQQFDTLQPGGFQTWSKGELSFFEVSLQNIWVALQNADEQLGHQLVLDGLLQAHSKLQQHDISTPKHK